MTNPDTIRCDDLERWLDDYLAGTLSEAQSVALEMHAASCARCEARLEVATRRPGDLSLTVPPTLREDTLRVVAAARRTTRWQARRAIRRPWVWTGAITTLAAAALVLIVTRDAARPNVRALGIDSVRGPAIAAATDDNIPNRDRAAARLADQEARSEFAALDIAAHELEEALAAAPSDRELRAYLSSVRARRDELARRVKAATS